MKPRNFPERKRQRQLRALKQREHCKTKYRSAKAFLVEIDALMRAVSVGNQRHERTKKFRGAPRAA